MHDVAGLKNPGSTADQERIDAGYDKERNRTKLAYARMIKISIDFVEDE